MRMAMRLKRITWLAGVLVAGVIALPQCGEAAPITISSYDVLNAEASGFGGWSYQYTGTITPNGSLVNLTGGSGTLNDGLVTPAVVNNMLFTVQDKSVITA